MAVIGKVKLSGSRLVRMVVAHIYFLITSSPPGGDDRPRSRVLDLPALCADRHRGEAVPAAARLIASGRGAAARVPLRRAACPPPR